MSNSPGVTTPLPSQSALDSLLHAYPPPATASYSSDLHCLALQTAHNLKYMHLWSDIHLHTHSPNTADPLPRPLLSGTPPNRLYVHPDEQIALLQRQKDEGKTGMPELDSQREWVVPSHLREKWSLSKFGDIFDAISILPEVDDGEAIFPQQHVATRSTDGNDKWRQDMPKRLLLATLDDDSAIVYYIVHDGIVKPRQN